MTDKDLAALERAVIDVAEGLRDDHPESCGRRLVKPVDALRAARRPKWEARKVSGHWFAGAHDLPKPSICFGEGPDAERWAREFVALRVQEGA